MGEGTRRAPVWAALALVITLGACSGGSDDSALSPSSTPPPPPPSPSPSSTATPSGLEIPAIDVSVPLQPEGLRGGVVNPEAGTVIWVDGYERVAPGELGTAVVAGHVADGPTPDIFADLAEVVEGDTFTIKDSDGGSTTFDVTDVFTVDKESLTTDPVVWGANDTERRVVLVTCDDVLGLRGDGHRVANLVVVGEIR
jgi:LPXTG-site transpeptidase (sortase) family protein